MHGIMSIMQGTGGFPGILARVREGQSPDIKEVSIQPPVGTQERVTKIRPRHTCDCKIGSTEKGQHLQIISKNSPTKAFCPPPLCSSNVGADFQS